MEDAHLAHFVVLYWIPEGCIIAEIHGAAVCQFGPFADQAQPLKLAAGMFGPLPTVMLADQAAPLDDEAVLVLGNRLHQRQR